MESGLADHVWSLDELVGLLGNRRQRSSSVTQEAPIFFYLFPKGNSIEISRLTTAEASKLWDRGEHWIDMPQKTLSEAQELKRQIISGRSSMEE